MGPGCSYSLEVYLHDWYFCHFMPFFVTMPFYTILYHFLPPGMGKIFYAGKKTTTLLTTGVAPMSLPGWRPTRNLLAVLTPDGMFSFPGLSCPICRAVLSDTPRHHSANFLSFFAPVAPVSSSFPARTLIQVPLVCCACCASFYFLSARALIFYIFLLGFELVRRSVCQLAFCSG